MLCINPFKVISSIISAPLRLLGIGGQQPQYQPPRILVPEIKIPEMPKAKPPGPEANKTASELSAPPQRKQKQLLAAQGTTKLRNDLTSNYSGSTGLNIPYK